MITISGKALGSRRKLFDDFGINLPPGDDGDGDDFTLRDLIARVVREQVRAYLKRQHENQFLKALSASAIREAAERGKVLSGGSEVPQVEVDPEHAIAAALQAFEDGLYLVVIDGTQARDLDAQVFVNEQSKLTFVRLTLLSGA